MSCTEHEAGGGHRDAEGREHRHGPGCGHTEIKHRGHADYLHDGHLHAPHESHHDEHTLEVDRRRPAACAPVECDEAHGVRCGHEPVPHGDHVDYVVGGSLHHPHRGHCDLHGRI